MIMLLRVLMLILHQVFRYDYAVKGIDANTTPETAA